MDTQVRTSPPRTAGRSLAIAFIDGLYVYLVSGAVVLAGAYFGYEFVKFCALHPQSNERVDLIDSFCAWDGHWYQEIVREGYSYSAGRPSNVAFFPAYPAASALVARMGACSDKVALLAVSNSCFLAALVLLALYLQGMPGVPESCRSCILTCVAVFPSGLFFRMAYTESMFIVIVCLLLIGIQRKWTFGVIAALVGAASAVRVTGIALWPVLCLYVIDQSQDWRKAFFRIIVLTPICLWGIVAFSVYQGIALGEPLAFVKTQDDWGFGSPPMSARLWRIATFEPLWSAFDARSDFYWAKTAPNQHPLLNGTFLNPLVFAGFVALVAYGWRSRTLDRYECVLGLLLLIVPYLLQGMRAGSLCFARFASVCIPGYIVMGTIISGWPETARYMVFGFSLVVLFCHTAMFANWYWFF